MEVTIRRYTAADRTAVGELSIRAWAPVFASLAAAMDAAVFGHFYPDWPNDQRKAVAAVCGAESNQVWVALLDQQLAGFVATTLHQATSMGEIVMLAVDPSYQQRGVGAALTKFALEQFRNAGMRVAMVETGGDPGHEPARQTYAKQGFQLMPVARYFQAL
ncbi:GNAT family N-acetyltransferase [Herpetosiphon geysericola]|uniref:GNAT family acetyltransferase n=1 Tax=Herpetosiphon geysericola TaxID=70996 RepID=A0A0P6YGU4_9CHLR|nr:GNAT family N-acetyltransferase [Herpetosiphon geysericola]KPL91436.1 GNAT family acetyltransferase [Herpetosiphon geysericola]